MREGDDPRDIYWRKSTVADQLVLRERARETRRDVEYWIDAIHPGPSAGGRLDRALRAAHPRRRLARGRPPQAR